MRVAKQLGLVLLAVCAVSALAVSSASASPVFLSHPLGLLLASAGNNQVFTAGGLTVECTALKLLPPGDTTRALTALAILVVVDYEKCTGPLALKLVVHPVRYLIDANGLVTLENTVLLLGPEECVITLPAASNQSLQTVKFENTPANKGVLLLSEVEGITASGQGGPGGFGCSFTEEHKAKYKGTIHVTVDGGLLKWDLNA